MALYLQARAKLNLVLRITGRRADGYHLLETLLHEIELHDDLWAERSERTSLEVSAASARAVAPADGSNLVVRAADAFAAAAGGGQGVRFRLHKRIPPGAGLGGGSADAAAALRLCNELAGSPLANAALHELARSLGADVPFFLRGGSQWGRGIGDELQPATVAPQHFVLLVPPYACPTAEVYRNWSTPLRNQGSVARVPPATILPGEDSGGPWRFVNDLEAAAERVRPELAGLRAMVAKEGFPSVAMTGSGSTLFLAFADASACATALARLRPLDQQGVRLLATRSAGVQASPVQRAWPLGGAENP